MTETKEPIIQIRNVSKRFGKVTAVDNISLDIRAGEFFVLLGPSGCGKTTLLRMIAGFELPTEGQILIDGQDMSLVPPNKRPVNMVFQSYAVFPHMNVTDNVGYGLRISGVSKGEIRDRVAEALELVKLGGFEDRMPDQMSGGQRQRLALARALLKDAPILILDEATSALDTASERYIQQALHKVMRNRTTLVIAHRLSTIENADMILVMERGRIVERGSHHEDGLAVLNCPHDAGREGTTIAGVFDQVGDLVGGATGA